MGISLLFPLYALACQEAVHPPSQKPTEASRAFLEEQNAILPYQDIQKLKNFRGGAYYDKIEAQDSFVTFLLSYRRKQGEDLFILERRTERENGQWTEGYIDWYADGSVDEYRTRWQQPVPIHTFASNKKLIWQKEYSKGLNDVLEEIFPKKDIILADHWPENTQKP